MWWEDPIVPQKPQEDVICPVCKAVIDMRDKGARCWSHCNECNCDFYYPENTAIPTNVSPSWMQPKKCGCGRCGR